MGCARELIKKFYGVSGPAQIPGWNPFITAPSARRLPPFSAGSGRQLSFAGEMQAVEKWISVGLLSNFYKGFRLSARSRFQTLGDVEFDRAIAGFEILNRGSQVDAKPLRSVVGKDHPVIELERFVEDVSEEIRVQAEVNDDFIWGLGDPAYVGVAGAHTGCIDLWGGRLGFFAHNIFWDGRTSRALHGSQTFFTTHFFIPG